MLPAFDPRPWGTEDLSPIYPNHKFPEKIGEAWLTGDNCKVANGPLAGKTLGQLSEQYQHKLVGEAARDPRRFPLLLKFLFPHEKLSVQVHPDDEQAVRMGQPWGKTECWYVAHAEPGAQIALGLKPGVTASQLEEAIHQNRAEGMLNWINICAGDMIYVAGGTVHTLGPGSVIIETQQQSDTTYRLYDYGRPRELHLKEGMAAVKEKVGSGKVVRPAPRQIGGRNRLEPLIAAPYFVVDRFEVKEPLQLATRDDSGRNAVQVLVAVEGCAAVEAPGTDSVTFAKGDAVVVPACVGNFSVRPQWAVEFLRAYAPGKPFPEPETRM
jgi:mannose-6-phosphate isomerase